MRGEGHDPDVNRNDRAIVGLVMLAHGMVHTYELSIPIFVDVWLETFAVDEVVLGVVVTVGYGLFGLGALPGGVLADTFGSRRLILVCLSGMGLSFGLLALAPSIPTIALALLVWGAAASVYHPSGLSLISTGVEKRGTGFAYHGMAGNFGIAVGPLVTTLLLVFVDWQVVAGLLVVPAVLGSALAVRIDVDEEAAVAADEGGEGRAEAVQSLPGFLDGTRRLFVGSFVLIFGVVIMSGLYYRGVLTFLPGILAEVNALAPVSVGERTLEPSRFAYVGILMVGMAGQFVGGKLTDRFRPAVGIVAAFGALALLAIVFLPVAALGLAALVAVGALLGFFLFLVQPFYQAAVAELTPPGTRGLSYGYTYLGVFGVGATGGAIAGAVLTYGTAAALFLVLAGVAGVATLLGLWLLRRE